MNKKIELNKRPHVIIDEAYYDRLHSIAESFLNRNAEVANRLIDEISRAEICISKHMPESVVNLGSRVTYRDEITGKTETINLVWPFEADISEKRISVMTPIGAALIGLEEGASIDWKTNSGEIRHLTVVSVKPQ